MRGVCLSDGLGINSQRVVGDQRTDWRVIAYRGHSSPPSPPPPGALQGGRGRGGWAGKTCIECPTCICRLFNITFYLTIQHLLSCYIIS